eukprot:143969-Alexandrium_andersonii.AAC.1
MLGACAIRVPERAMLSQAGPALRAQAPPGTTCSSVVTWLGGLPSAGLIRICLLYTSPSPRD